MESGQHSGHRYILFNEMYHKEAICLYKNAKRLLAGIFCTNVGRPQTNKESKEDYYVQYIDLK